MRTQIASDLHDDVGSTLTSISYYSEIIKMNLKEEKNGLNIMLDKIGNSARSMVNAMNDIVWVVNPANDETINLLSKMKSHASEVLGERNMHYTFDADAEKIKPKLSLQQRKNIYLIYKETLNNAVKYAGCCHIAISITQTNNRLSLKIKDNGKGFDVLKATAGNGLNNMKYRAAEIKASLNINSYLCTGTLVQLDMKIT